MIVFPRSFFTSAPVVLSGRLRKVVLEMALRLGIIVGMVFWDHALTQIERLVDTRGAWHYAF